jgi:alpha-mannosidase
MILPFLPGRMETGNKLHDCLSGPAGQGGQERMKRGLHAACFSLLPFVVLLLGWPVAAQAELLWTIGTSDDSYDELAIARNYPRYSQTFPNDVTFRIGQSQAGRDWSYVHPGPRDGWAGYREHPFRIEFDCTEVPDGDSILTVETVSTHGTVPPKLRIAVNGHCCRFDLPRGPDNNALTDPAKGSPYEVSLRFDSALLQTGPNTIVLTAVDGNWLLYDAVRFESGWPHSAGSDIRDFHADPTMFYARDGGGILRQVIEAVVYNAGTERAGTIRVDFGGEQWDVQLPEIGLGPNRHLVLVPEVTASTPALLTLLTGGESFSAAADVEPQRKWRVYISPHTHTDIGYSASQPAIMNLHRRILDGAVDACERLPDFTWNCEIAWQAENYAAGRPQAKVDALMDLMREGRIGLHGTYMNMLTGLCSHEELNRLFYFAKGLQREQGVPVSAATITDVPTCVGSLPAALAGSGIPYFSQGINGYRAPFLLRTDVTSPFWWEGPDGSRVLTYLAAHYGQMGALRLQYNCDEVRKTLPGLLRGYEQTGYPFDAVFLYGAYPDNAPFDARFAEVAAEWNAAWAYPRIILCRDEEYFEYMLQNYADRIPVFKGDAGAYWEDGAASSAFETAMNRKTHESLPTAEKLHACTALLGSAEPYPATDLRQAWSDVMWYDEHTWGSHRSVSAPAHPDVAEQWAYKIEPAYRASSSVDAMIKSGMERLAGLVQTGSRPAILVFNPLSWSRTDLATVVISGALSRQKAIELIDIRTGKRIPAQRTGGTSTRPEYAFVAEDVPPLGYRLYEAAPSTVTADPQISPIARGVFENRFFRLRLDPATGAVSSIFDKRLGTELLDPESPYGANQYLYVAGSGANRQMHALESVTVGSTASRPAFSEAAALDPAAIPAAGPVRKRVIVQGQTLHTPRLESEIVLYENLPRIDFIDRLLKEETVDKEAVYFAFPFAARPPVFSYEGPDSIVQPASDMLKGACLDWFAVQHWVDVYGPSAGMTLASPDSPLVCLGDITVGMDLREFDPPTGGIFAYVMNNSWDTNYRAAQGGEVAFRYSLQSHSGRFDAQEATRFGWGSANPLQTVTIPANQDGPLAGPVASFCVLAPGNVVLLAFKEAEDGNGWILRLWEVEGESATATLRFPLWEVTRAALTNLVEEDGESLPVMRGIVFVPVGAHAVVTVRIR